jgi:signal transduction histidine kinase
MRDITAEKRAREMLKAQNAELQGFMHAVSHDLKTPLITIREYSSLLLKDYSDKLSGDEMQIIERLNQNSLKAIEMIKGLQSYAQYASKKKIFERFNLGNVIKEVLSDLDEGRGLPQDVHIHLKNNWPQVTGDRTILYQVFLNLITNAVKYQGRNIEIGWGKEPDETLVWIKDDGIGIEDDFKEKAFEMFTRSSRVSEMTEGTGIGLALVKKSVERHGGRVWCESDPGKGATFLFTIPPAANVDDSAKE